MVKKGWVPSNVWLKMILKNLSKTSLEFHIIWMHFTTVNSFDTDFL